MSIKISVACVAVALAIAACGSEASPPARPETKSGSNAGVGKLGGASDGSLPTDFAQCATKTAGAEAKPIYLVFMFDRSGSMIVKNSPKWASATAATRAFFASTASVATHASISFFPDKLDFSCQPTDYAAPVARMSALPSADLGGALDAHAPEPNGGTPTYVALSGALQYASTIAATDGKDGKVAVVLVTDGLPDSDCAGNSVPEVQTLAASSAAAIPTYVIGVGSQLRSLDAIAKGGATDHAYIVQTEDPTRIEHDFREAIDTIRTSLACDYEIPPPPTGEQLDRDLVNVLHRSGGKTKTIPQDPACASGTGWRYDDPNAPKRILLCESTCRDVNATPSTVDVIFGCATKRELK